MPRKIDFPDIPPRYVFERDCVAFPALVDGKPIRCMISMEALMQDFGARGHDEEEIMRAFHESRLRIQEAARRKLENGSVIPDEGVLIWASMPSKLNNRIFHFLQSPELTKRPDLTALLQDISIKYIGRYAPAGIDVKVYWDFAGMGNGDLFQVKLEDTETSGTTVDWVSRDQLKDSEYLRRRFDFLWAEFLGDRSAKQLSKIRSGNEES
jgi:Protein of unknown function (DUF1488)